MENGIRKAAATALSENDSSVILYIGTPYLKAMPIAEGIVSAARKTGKPIAAVMRVGSDIDERAWPTCAMKGYLVSRRERGLCP